MKRTVVFRMVGNADDFGRAAIDGMKTTLTNEELETVKAELKKTQAENAQLGVRKVRDNKDFAKKMRKLRHKYPPVKESSKAAQTALLVWAITCLTIKACYERLAAINRAA